MRNFSHILTSNQREPTDK